MFQQTYSTQTALSVAKFHEWSSAIKSWAGRRFVHFSQYGEAAGIASIPYKIALAFWSGLPVSPHLSRLSGLVVAALMPATINAAAQPASPAEPTGEWLVAEHVARIQIVNCDDGRLWGVVSWEMRAGTDSNNPDPALRTRPTLGMPVLMGMSQSKTNQWDGKIYNSKDGHTYSANISLLDANTLRVRGCFLGFLCGGENWTRVQPQPANAPPPKASSSRTSPSKSTAALASAPPETSEQICLRLVGPPGLPHEGGLK